MGGVEIQRVSSDRELDALVGLFNRLETSSVTPARMKQMRQAMRRQDVLAWSDGRPVGFGLVGLFPGMEETREAAARFAVLPEHRRRGIGGRLHAELCRLARELGRDALEVQVPGSDERSREWLERRGYRENERLSLRLDLVASTLPALSVPPGVQLVSFADQPEHAVALFDLVRETIADVPGTVGEQVPEDFEAWAALELDPQSRPPEFAILALDGVTLAGAGWVRRDGIQKVWHSYTGVRRPWRGRGIARAIKLAQLHAARATGCRYSLTDNHVDNAPIAKLNRELGYEPYDVKITLVGGTVG
ncbi:MAG TPA: GNAT family N-acetyltransferase [Gaiellaceae bacterium]|nr:GNAT family N-acetyltransferase [Gaiellaceae bacterium]